MLDLIWKPTSQPYFNAHRHQNAEVQATGDLYTNLKNQQRATSGTETSANTTFFNLYLAGHLRGRLLPRYYFTEKN